MYTRVLDDLQISGLGKPVNSISALFWIAVATYTHKLWVLVVIPINSNFCAQLSAFLHTTKLRCVANPI